MAVPVFRRSSVRNRRSLPMTRFQRPKKALTGARTLYPEDFCQAVTVGGHGRFPVGCRRRFDSREATKAPLGLFYQTGSCSNQPFGEVPCPSASPETNASVPCETGAPAATFAYLARRACSMNARRTAFMRVW